MQQQVVSLIWSSDLQRINSTLFIQQNSVEIWEGMENTRHADPITPQVFPMLLYMPARGFRTVW